jgi:hypothetical protein
MQSRRVFTTETALDGRGLAFEQRHEAAARVQRHEVVVAAHVRVADENLRHGAPPGDLHHALARCGVGVHADFLDLLHALGLQ